MSDSISQGSSPVSPRPCPATVHVDAEGVRFGDFIWFSHEAILQRSVETSFGPIGERAPDFFARKYREWVASVLAEGSASSEGAEAVAYREIRPDGKFVDTAGCYYPCEGQLPQRTLDAIRSLGGRVEYVYPRPQPAQGEPATVDALAQFIRTTQGGKHERGAVELAELILQRFTLSNGEHEQRSCEPAAWLNVIGELSDTKRNSDDEAVGVRAAALIRGLEKRCSEGSEQRPAKTLAWLVERWRAQAKNCRETAERIGESHNTYMELLRDAAQYEQCAGQVERCQPERRPIADEVVLRACAAYTVALNAYGSQLQRCSAHEVAMRAALESALPRGLPAGSVKREDAEAFLAKYHAQVWEAAENGGEYDYAGRELAKQFLARFDATAEQPSCGQDARDVVCTEQDAYELGYRNPSTPARDYEWKHLVDVNAFICGQLDYQNTRPMSREYRRTDYDPDTRERKQVNAIECEQPSCGQDARDWHAKQDGFENMGGKPFTYQHQPNNIGAWRIGEACCAAKPGGDYIDHGLSLLQQLQMRGYGIVPVAAIAAQ